MNSHGKEDFSEQIVFVYYCDHRPSIELHMSNITDKHASFQNYQWETHEFLTKSQEMAEDHLIFVAGGRPDL